MKEPLANWKNLKRGFRFGQQTFYNESHTGLDILVPSNTPVYAPFTGSLKTYYGAEGGNWLELRRSNNEIFRVAHLSSYIKTEGMAFEGEKIALTGNSGKITTQAHAHIEVKVNNILVDPEQYFKEKPEAIIHATVFKLLCINIERSLRQEFIEQVHAYTKGALQIEASSVFYDLSAAQGSLSTAEAEHLLKDTGTIHDGAYIDYKGDSSATYLVTYLMTPNFPYATLPRGQYAVAGLIHEFLHMLRKKIVSTRYGINDVEYYPSHLGANTTDPGWRFQEQFDQLIPYLHLIGEMSTESMFELLQAEGTKDIFIVRNGEKTLIYNYLAFKMIGDATKVKRVLPSELNAIPDSGVEIAGLNKE